MTSFSIQVQGDNEAVAALEKVVVSTLAIMDGYTKATLPKEMDNETPIRTGALRKANRVEAHHNGFQLNVSFKNDMPYATFVINGTSRMKANNYPERVSRKYQAKLDYYTRDWLSRF